MENINLITGGLISWVVLTTIKFTQQNSEYNLTKKRIETEVKNDETRREFYGDIDAYLTDTLGLVKSNFLDELTLNGMRPLLILAFVSFFYKTSFSGNIVAIIIFLFSILHEFLYAEKNKNNGGYRFLIFLVWLLFILSFLEIIVYNPTSN